MSMSIRSLFLTRVPYRSLFEEASWTSDNTNPVPSLSFHLLSIKGGGPTASQLLPPPQPLPAPPRTGVRRGSGARRHGGVGGVGPSRLTTGAEAGARGEGGGSGAYLSGSVEYREL